MQCVAKNHGFELRIFESADWEGLKSSKLAVLRDQGFWETGAAFNEVARREQSYWKDLTEGIKSKHFGLYDGERLIGVTCLEWQEEKKRDAVFTGSYIFKSYRGRGLSRLLYQGRLNFLKASGDFEKATAVISERNAASQKAASGNGFVETDALLHDGAYAEKGRYYLPREVAFKIYTYKPV